MGKRRGWLIGPSVLIGLVAATGLARYAQRAEATHIESTDAVAPSGATNDVSCFDTSPHKTTFVTVAPGVRLEVLDWGGSGEPMVLLTGSGDNAHAFDEFAFQFTDRFHVYGITRRGFGRSSQPASGYDLDTRARDDIAVLDTLGIRQAVFVGHSIAGTELDRIATGYPGRVDKLVFLDALDIGGGGWSKLPQPPPSPEVSARLIAGLHPAVYERIRAPTLGIFNRITPPYRTPYYWYLKPAEQAEFDRHIAPLATWTGGAIERFRSEVKGSRVIELPNANHYVYVEDEALVVREMRDFLIGK